MGDFLDDYLDGLSEGQRFNPLPYGPYYGTKDKRQWHLLADDEREQAIFEARMREEEESASAADAAAGADAGGSHISLTRQRARDAIANVPSIAEIIEQATTTPVTQEAYSQVADTNSYETYGDLVDYETGEITMNFTLSNPETTYSVQAVTDTATVVESDPVLTQDRFDIDAPPSEYVEWQAGETITSIASTDPQAVMLIGAHPDTLFDPSQPTYLSFGTIDTGTGLIYPTIAIGGDYAIQFRLVGLEHSSVTLDSISVYPQIEGESANMVYLWEQPSNETGPGYIIFEVYVSAYLTAAQTLEKIEQEWKNFDQTGIEGQQMYSTYTAEQAGLTGQVFAWTYSVIKIT